MSDDEDDVKILNIPTDTKKSLINILRNMQASKDNMIVVRQGIDLLGDKARESFNNRNGVRLFMIEKMNVPKVLHDSMLAYPHDEPLQRFACYAIIYLLLDIVENKNRYEENNEGDDEDDEVQAEVTESAAMTASEFTEAIPSAASSAVAATASASTSTPANEKPSYFNEACEKFISVGIIDCIERALVNHKHSDRLYLNALSSLAELSKDTRSLPHFIRLNIEEHVCYGLEVFPETSSYNLSGSNKSWGDKLLETCKKYRIEQNLQEFVSMPLYTPVQSTLVDAVEEEAKFIINSDSDLEKAKKSLDVMKQTQESMRRLEVKSRNTYLEAIKRVNGTARGSTKVTLDDIKSHRDIWESAYKTWRKQVVMCSKAASEFEEAKHKYQHDLQD